MIRCIRTEKMGKLQRHRRMGHSRTLATLVAGSLDRTQQQLNEYYIEDDRKIIYIIISLSIFIRPIQVSKCRLLS